MYDACIDSARKGCFRHTNGSQRRGSSHAAHFWMGYNGTIGAFANPADAEYRTTLGYAAYRAGADYAIENPGISA